MILIADNNVMRRRSVSEMLNYMGILSSDTEPSSVLYELRDRYSALLFTSEDSLCGCVDIETIYETGVPIYAIAHIDSREVRLCFDEGESIAKIAAMIKYDMKKRGEKAIGEYTLGTLDASDGTRGVRWAGIDLALTRTEAMIIRFLIASHPRTVSADEVLRHAFRESRAPDSASVRTHISIINKKLKGIIGQALILSSERRGYIISEEALSRTISSEPTGVLSP